MAFRIAWSACASSPTSMRVWSPSMVCTSTCVARAFHPSHGSGTVPNCCSLHRNTDTDSAQRLLRRRPRGRLGSCFDFHLLDSGARSMPGPRVDQHRQLQRRGRVKGGRVLHGAKLAAYRAPAGNLPCTPDLSADPSPAHRSTHELIGGCLWPKHLVQPSCEQGWPPARAH